MYRSKNVFFSIILIFVLILGCQSNTGPAPQATSAQITSVFLSHFAPYCGQTFKGQSTYTDLGEDHPLDGAQLTMIVQSCEENEIRIPFYVEDDRSRTWIFTQTPDGLRLSHDHRYEDGSEYEANMYGGVAMENTGVFEHYPEGLYPSETLLFFPADSRTLADRPAREINVWSTEFNLYNQIYFYRLFLYGELRYEAAFDLSSPVETDG